MRSLFVVVVLIATLVHQSTAQLPFGPVFHLSQYPTSEGGQQVVQLSATILTSSPVTFTGSIEVDIAAEDISAEFGSDYIVNLQSPLSRIFTVAFQSRQANSTEHLIFISDDVIYEGREAFRLRIVAARFLGQAASVFRARDRLNETTADVIIEDNDYIEVNWTISVPIEVTEGDEVEVRLRAEAFGIYANPIQIGVVCAPTQVTGVPAASLGSDFTFTPGTRLNFTDIETIQSLSIEKLVVPIINDDIAEPCESFICTLQGGALDAIRGIEPNRVTIRICDDDALIVRWAQDVYEFTESHIATVELVTNSTFEVAQVNIQGFPRQIPDGNPNRIPSLVVPGPAFTGYSFNATIERATSPIHRGNFGNAQVAQSSRPDVVSTINDFVFAPASQSAFESFTIVNDSVLEFDELFIAEINFGPEIANTWNAIKGEPSTTFIVIRDDDSVVVTFNEGSYTAEEIAAQISVSLRIDGKFFYPVWAVVEISDGTATDPGDYSSAKVYNVTFRQTAFTDGEDPEDTALSSPILIDIVSDDVFEGVEYFQARIVETSDAFRVRIGQDTVNVTINDDDMSTFIQLLLRPVSDCLTWAETEGAAKLSDISVALSVALQQQCGCSLFVQQSLFSCFGTTDSQTVVFLAELFYTALPGVDMPSLLTSWVTSTPYLAVASTQLQVDTTCPVVIDSLQPEQCSAASVAPSTVPPADPSSNPATDSPTDTTVIVIVVAVAAVVLLVMVAAIVAIVIAVIIFCSKQSKYSPRPGHSLPNPVHEEYECMENESGGMAMTSMTKNPSYTTTKEMLASFTFNAEEDKTVHTYKVLPFEANEGNPENLTQRAETTADKHACE